MERHLRYWNICHHDPRDKKWRTCTSSIYKIQPNKVSDQLGCREVREGAGRWEDLWAIHDAVQYTINNPDDDNDHHQHCFGTLKTLFEGEGAWQLVRGSKFFRLRLSSSEAAQQPALPMLAPPRLETQTTCSSLTTTPPPPCLPSLTFVIHWRLLNIAVLCSVARLYNH